MYSPMEETIHQELSEFLSVSSSDENFFNSRGKTEALIQLFKKYKPKVGSFEIKNMKRLWEAVARDLSNMFRITISATKCENRWKVLERNYKKVVDNNNQTGRGRKHFEFEEEFDLIYGKKTNIRPPILLSSSETIYPSISSQNNDIPTDSNCQITSKLYITEVTDKNANETPENNQASEVSERIGNTVSIPTAPPSGNQKRKRSIRTVTPNYKKRNEILLDMKNDFKQYYDNKSKRDYEKLELSKKKMEDRQKRAALLEQYVNMAGKAKN